ncbi:MAG: sterol desaturase family protein [Albidovulum sp.]|nr:sterol desaturase family protein [Albidovulum sp.]MDE0304456.1 sterol desaturase family protein [Albidovulum sp.]MDE0533240.1 sterol desaturase family protein [Albidovulum sp.]
MADAAEIFENGDLARIAVFVGALAILAIAEVIVPKQRHEIPRLIRWTNNFGVVIVDALLVRIVFPVAATGLAVVAHEEGWGLLNIMAAPGWLAFLASFLFFDFVIYIQHVVLHAVPALWRLHRMHHADLEFDVSTGLRFHPGEILLSFALKLAVVLAIGPPAAAVLVFEIVLNATSMFNHSNIRIPPRADRLLRWILVTPDMHRIHHSVYPTDNNSNFGFNLPWWDRLLGTYRSKPKDGYRNMTIGLDEFRTRRDLWLDRMLTQPFRNDPEEDASVSEITSSKPEKPEE